MGQREASIAVLLSLLILASTCGLAVGTSGQISHSDSTSSPNDSSTLATPPSPTNNSTNQTTTAYPDNTKYTPPTANGTEVEPASEQTNETAKRFIYLVRAESPEAVDTTQIASLGANVTTTYKSWLEVTARSQTAQAIRNISWVQSVSLETAPTTAEVDEATESVQASDLRFGNVSGEGVKVGVITLGVNPSSPTIASQVEATRSFHPSGLRGDDSTHGTAVAESVSNIAPNSSLYLASFDTFLQYRQAADWMVSQDVDVIVMSIGWPSARTDGSSPVSQVATSATEQGILWVNSAGNAGENHYSGAFNDPNANSWWNFDGVNETNLIAGGNSLTRGEQVTFWMRWQEPAADESNYELYLFDSNYEEIATSRVDSQANRGVLSTTIPHDGRYFFAVRGPRSDSTLHIIGSDNTRPFQYHVREGSITAPASARNVLGTGAYYIDTGQLESFSSAGPTDDGRQGVDILGPNGAYSEVYGSTFYGTSAAAPHVAGGAALLLSMNDSAQPETIRRVLKGTATDVQSPGVDAVSGSGRVNIAAAGEALDPTVPLEVTPANTTTYVGEETSYQVVRQDTNTPVNATVTLGEESIFTGQDGGFSVTWDTAGTRQLSIASATNPPYVDYQPTTTTTTVRERTASFTIDRLRGPTTVSPDGQFMISAEITNNGSVSGTQNITLALDGTEITTQELSVAAGATEQVDFELSTANLTAGEHTYQIETRNDRATGTVTIETSTSGNESTTSLPEVSTTNATIAPGENGTVEFSIQNPSETDYDALGMQVTEFPAELSVQSTTSDGQKAAGELTWFWTTGLPAQTEHAVSIDIQVPENATAGQHRIAVNIASPEMQRVHAQVTVREGSRFDTDDDGKVGFQELLGVINAYSSDETINGESVSFSEVLAAIDAYSTN